MPRSFSLGVGSNIFAFERSSGLLEGLDGGKGGGLEEVGLCADVDVKLGRESSFGGERAWRMSCDG